MALRDGAGRADDAGPPFRIQAIAMRLVLGDDQAIFLDALASVLTQHGYEVGAVARSPEEMVAQVRHQRPDACLIDCNLAVGDGTETIRRVLQADAATTVVVLSADPEAESAQRALEAGASGYLHQSRGVAVLVSALERTLNGEQVLDVPDVTGRRPRKETHADSLAATLTGRERECLSLLVAGLDTTTMTQRLGVSRTTVRTHLQAVLTKLCVHSRLEAASFAVRHRLVDAWTEPAAVAGGQAGRSAAVNSAGADPSRQRLTPTGRSRRQTTIRAVGQEQRQGPRLAAGPMPQPAWQGVAELAASG
jgi:two-component system nitrate/nitrite response regulator NarL